TTLLIRRLTEIHEKFGLTTPIQRDWQGPVPKSNRRSINLARRTIESRTSALNDAFYCAVAASSPAGFTLTIVSGKHFLKIAKFPIRLPMIAQRRTAGSHRFLQHRFDGGG